MLRAATEEDIRRYGDRFYDIALDPARTSYPIYTDGIKSKADFIAYAKRGVAAKEYELLLFEYQGNVEGWVQYYWIPEDAYLQIGPCIIARHTDAALREVLDHLTARFPGYSLYWGLPSCNLPAVSFLEARGFACVEDDYNNSFFFDAFEPFPDPENVVRINEANYGDFHSLCGQEDGSVYWNSRRIREHLDLWRIFVCYSGGQPAGAVYYQGGGASLEIFGVQFAGDRYRKDVFQTLLRRALNEGKRSGARYMTFFCDDACQPAVLELGFTCVGRYLCYVRQI